MGKTPCAVEALGLQTAVAEHLDDLGVFLAFLLEDELALLVVILVLTPTSILATLHNNISSGWRQTERGGVLPLHDRNVHSTHLSLILRHIGLLLVVSVLLGVWVFVCVSTCA